jgi:hypothetical protein
VAHRDIGLEVVVGARIFNDATRYKVAIRGTREVREIAAILSPLTADEVPTTGKQLSIGEPWKAAWTPPM